MWPNLALEDLRDNHGEVMVNIEDHTRGLDANSEQQKSN